MKVKFLKRFRKRFTITVDRSRFFPVVLLDHKLKKQDCYNSISLAVAYSAIKIAGFDTWMKRMRELDRREDRRKYYKAYFQRK